MDDGVNVTGDLTISILSRPSLTNSSCYTSQYWRSLDLVYIRSGNICTLVSGSPFINRITNISAKLLAYQNKTLQFNIFLLFTTWVVTRRRRECLGHRMESRICPLGPWSPPDIKTRRLRETHLGPSLRHLGLEWTGSLVGGYYSCGPWGGLMLRE